MSVCCPSQVNYAFWAEEPGDIKDKAGIMGLWSSILQRTQTSPPVLQGRILPNALRGHSDKYPPIWLLMQADLYKSAKRSKMGAPMSKWEVRHFPKKFRQRSDSRIQCISASTVLCSEVHGFEPQTTGLVCLSGTHLSCFSHWRGRGEWFLWRAG